MKNILIIGGSYFVGKVFVEELVKESDYSINVLNRGNRPLRIQGVKEIVCDRNDVDKFKQSVSSTQWDVVVDFCAYSPQDIENALSVFPKGGVKHYIYISTTSIYQPTQMLPIIEDAPTADTSPGKAVGFAEFPK